MSVEAAAAGAPVPPVPGVRSVLEEERDFLLRSLRDLDDEHAAGDIDNSDYRSLRADYTTRAATVLRRLRDPSELVDPAPAADRPGRAAPAAADAAAEAAEAELVGAPIALDGGGRGRRRRWRVVGVVGVSVLAAVVISWAVVASSGSRLPGGAATGQAVGQEQVAKLLLAGQQAAAKGDGVAALEDLEKVLKVDPGQVQALASEGWILAQTRQPQLLQQGIGLLARAERLDATYPPTHVYLGVSYLTESDYTDAARELQWYLAHNPDPGLVARVRQALSQAQAGQARAAAPATP